MWLHFGGCNNTVNDELDYKRNGQHRSLAADVLREQTDRQQNWQSDTLLSIHLLLVHSSFTVVRTTSLNRPPATIWSSDSLYSFKTQLKLTFLFISNVGAPELDSMLRQLRNWRFIIILSSSDWYSFTDTSLYSILLQTFVFPYNMSIVSYLVSFLIQFTHHKHYRRW